MDADYFASACIGVRVAAERLFEERRVKAFEHNYDPTWNVDPKTGRALWENERVFLLEDAGVACSAYDWFRRQNLGHVAVAMFDGDTDSSNTSGYITRLTTKVLDLNRAVVSNERVTLQADVVQTERLFLRELLAPLDLWNENEFGLWVVGGVI